MSICGLVSKSSLGNISKNIAETGLPTEIAPKIETKTAETNLNLGDINYGRVLVSNALQSREVQNYMTLKADITRAVDTDAMVKPQQFYGKMQAMINIIGNTVLHHQPNKILATEVKFFAEEVQSSGVKTLDAAKIASATLKQLQEAKKCSPETNAGELMNEFYTSFARALKAA